MTIATNSDVAISNIRLTTVGLTELSVDDLSATTTGIADASKLMGQTSGVKVCTLDGRLCRTIGSQTDENPLKGLKAGIYMIGNRKVVVR